MKSLKSDKGTEKLQELFKMKETGIISEGEYEELKAKMISQMLNEKTDKNKSGLAVFLAHIVAAVMDRKTDAGKGSGNVVRCDPICRFLRMIVITVDGKAVRADVIGSAAVAVLVLSAHIVASDRFFQRGFVRDIYLIRIQAVPTIADTVGTI